VITPEATAVYTKHVLKAGLGSKPKPTDKPTHDCRLLFTLAAMETPEFKALQAEVVRVARETWGEKADTWIKEGALRSPFRKDVVSKGHPAEYACFIGVKTPEDYPPGVVSREAGADGKPKPITDAREIYPGVKARCSIHAYTYGGPGTDYTPGVAFGLDGFQKLGDGPRLVGGGAGSDELGALPALPTAPLEDDAAAMAAMLA
jgi:hypothetical protein